MGKRIAVVGVGALGGYVGGNLAQAGEDVTLIDFWPENIETIRKRGLELDGVTPSSSSPFRRMVSMFSGQKSIRVTSSPVWASQPPT